MGSNVRSGDPLSVQISFFFASESFVARDFDRAIDRLQKTVSMDPNNPIVLDFLGAVFYHKKMPAEAFAAIEKADNLEGKFNAEEMTEMRKAYQTAGLPAYLRKANEFRQRHMTAGKYQSPYEIAARAKNGCRLGWASFATALYCDNEKDRFEK